MVKILFVAKGTVCTGTVNLNAKSGLRAEYHLPLSSTHLCPQGPPTVSK